MLGDKISDFLPEMFDGAPGEIDFERVIEELSDWEYQLKYADIDFEELGL